MYPKIARIVKQCRKQVGLNQHQLADLAGVGKTVIFDIEKGKETVKLSTLLKVFKALNIQIEFKAPYVEIENETSTDQDPQ